MMGDESMAGIMSTFREALQADLKEIFGNNSHFVLRHRVRKIIHRFINQANEELDEFGYRLAEPSHEKPNIIELKLLKIEDYIPIEKTPAEVSRITGPTLSLQYEPKDKNIQLYVRRDGATDYKTHTLSDNSDKLEAEIRTILLNYIVEGVGQQHRKK